jgi:3-dehydroquinate synthase
VPPSLEPRLRLRHPAGETPILVGAGALAEAPELLREWLAGRTLFVVSTPRVLGLHGARLAALTAPAARRVDLEVPEGEAAKTLAVAGGLWERMLAAGGKRDSRVLAFGGGSVGDLAGFAAACFLRGVPFAQVPTTLLAQVDAAIGGKTGVDLPGGKNTVGRFHHPFAVVCDTALLSTLPAAELRAGLAEVVKMGLILDPDLFGHVEADLPALLRGDAAALAAVVAEAAAVKAAVVERDPAESGERRLLNLGHTLGHALESALGYAVLRHGEAVAYGLLFALRLAERRGLAAGGPHLFARTRALLRCLDLPELPVAELAPADLLARLAGDKKARESGLTWVLPEVVAPGRAEGRLVGDLAPAEVAAELAVFLADPFAAVG